jgi:acylphosphatase
LQARLRLFRAAQGQRRWQFSHNRPSPLPNNDLSDADRARAHVRLLGRVQGVGFRYTTADEARRRHLNGWVRNLDSGAVEAVFEGGRADVEDMLRWCQAGPPGAHVREVRVSWDEPMEDLVRFEIRPTAGA